MGPIQIWRMLLARRQLVLAMVVVGLVAGTVVAKMWPKQYTATARIVLNVMQPDPVTGESITPRGVDTYVKTLTELIHDYRVTGGVVDHFGWTGSPVLRNAYESRSGTPDMDFRHWLASIVSSSTSASLVQGTNILEISYTSTSRDVAREGANAVRDSFIAQMLAQRQQSATKNAIWFQKQASDLKTQLASAEKNLADFERKNDIILDDTNTDTETARLRAMAGASAAPPVSVAAAPVSAPSTARLAEIDAKLSDARRTLGPNHPEILALQAQRAAAATDVQRELAASRAAANPSNGGAAMTRIIDAQEQKVLAQRGLVGQAQRLAGQVAVLRDQLQKTAQKAADFELQSQSNESGLEPLSVAATPQSPNAPSIVLFLIGGAAVGLFLGLALALLIELLFRRVRGAEDLWIEGVPVIGAMERETPRQENGGESFLQRLGLKPRSV